jgi:hypothetical protein
MSGFQVLNAALRAEAGRAIRSSRFGNPLTG